MPAAITGAAEMAGRNQDSLRNGRFDRAAAGWDQDPERVRMAEGIADVMIRHLQLHAGQVLVDYGAGTGLIALKLQPHVHKVIAVDASQGMLEALREKADRKQIANIEILRGSLEAGTAALTPADVLVSSMVLHHIRDTVAAAKYFWSALKPGGQIAIADLDQENGDFHSEPGAAQHHGFNRAELGKVFANAGFQTVRFHDACTRRKRREDGTEKAFSVFLMTALKPNA